MGFVYMKGVVNECLKTVYMVEPLLKPTETYSTTAK